MRKLIVLGFAWISFFHAGLAQGIELESLYVNAPIAPPSIVVFPIQITNSMSEQQVLSITATLPSGWSTLGIIPEAIVPPHSDRVILVPLRVPFGAEQGAYHVTFSATVAHPDTPIISVEETLVIQPVYHLIAEAREPRAIAPPGDIAEHILTLHNVGNASCNYQITWLSDWDTTAEPSHGTLPPGHEIPVLLQHQIPSDREAGEFANLLVQVTCIEIPSRTWTVDLVTRVSPPSPDLVSSNLMEWAQTELRFQSSAAPLSEEAATSLSLSASAPAFTGTFSADIRLTDVYGPEAVTTDVYQIRHRTETTDFQWGNIALTPSAFTTISFRGGLGLVQFERYGAGFAAGISDSSAHATSWVSAGYEGYEIAAGFVEQRSESLRETAWTAELSIEPLDTTHVQISAGFGTSNDQTSFAWKIALHSSNDILKLDAGFSNVGPWFLGSDRDQAMVEVDQQIQIDEVTVDLHYLTSRTNLLRLPNRLSRLEDAFRAGFLFAPSFMSASARTEFSFSWVRDPALLEDNLLTRKVLCGIEGLFRNLEGAFDAKLVDRIDRVEDSRSLLLETSEQISISWENASLYGRIMQHHMFLEESQTPPSFPSLEWTMGGTLGGVDTFASASFRKAGLLHEATMQLDAQWEESWLSIGAEWSWFTDDSLDIDFSWKADFGVALNLPMPFLVTKGQIEGVAFFDQNGNASMDNGEVGAENVILGIDSREARSSETGLFRFSPLQVGTYSLRILSYPPNTLPLTSTPIQVSLQSGQRVQLEIPLAEASSIEGRVIAMPAEYDPLSLSGRGREVGGALKNVSVSAAFSGDRIVQRTDEQGRFRFDHLLPGEWVLSIIDSTLPPFHQSNAPLAVRLTPGEHAKLELVAVIQQRSIELINQGTPQGILLSSPPSE